MVVLLLGFASGHEGHLARSLESRGVATALLDGTQGAARTTHLRMRNGKAEFSLRTPHGPLRLADVGCVWSGLRYPRVGREGVDPTHELLALEEWGTFLGNLAHVTSHVPWVNPWAAARRAETKTFQLSLAAEVGLLTPDTLVATDPDAVRGFLAEHPDGLAIKPLTHRPLVSQRTNVDWTLFTNYVGSDDPRWKEIESVRVAPVLLQEYVPKSSEVRAYVIDRKVQAVEIFSQSNPDTRVDWRRPPAPRPEPPADEAGPELPCRAVDLPDELSDRLRSLAARLGLPYSAMDLVRTPDGRLVFLEANDGGGWLEFEARAHLTVTRDLTDLLVHLHGGANPSS